MHLRVVSNIFFIHIKCEYLHQAKVNWARLLFRSPIILFLSAGLSFKFLRPLPAMIFGNDNYHGNICHGAKLN